MTFDVITIDDEMSCLNRFSRLIKNESRIKLRGCFISPNDALEFLANNHVHLIFLDIEMPEINGIDLARKIISLNSEVEIIFITAHEEFAFEAFNVYASGYLLKPIDSVDISALLDIIVKRKSYEEKYEFDNKLYVNSFGNVCCYSVGGKEQPVKWRTSKCEELILYLIHQRIAVSRDKIIDELWPNMSYEKAIKNLHVTSYNIRDGLKKINLKDIVIKKNGNYEIDKNKVVSDYWEFVDLLNDVKMKRLDFENIDILVEKYRSGYLNNKYYEWSDYAKDWMAIEIEKILYIILELNNWQSDFEKKIDTLLNIISINECDGSAYEQLIKMSMVSGNKNLAIMILKKYEKMLSKEFGIEVPKWILELF